MKTLLLILPKSELEEEFTKLLSNDFNIETVNSEDEGFRIFDERIDEIVGILVDLDLTRASGYRILKLLAQDKIYASVPVIAVIDHTPDASDMDCFENGFADLLYPPGFREQIVKRVQNAIRAKDSFTYSEMQKMLKQLPSNIYLKDAEGRYVFCTQYWHHINHEGEKHWTIRGKTDLDIRKDKENAKKAMETDKVMLQTGQGTDYIIEENDDGVREFLELVKRPVFDDDGNITGIIALINDVTEKELLKMELEKRSRTDPLTGLLNKGAVEELIGMMIRNYHNSNDCCGLLMIDVDFFKQINDTHGHAVGDDVLSRIGRIINGHFRGNDVAGRIGGDEFMIFLRNVESKETVFTLADRLIKQVQKEFENEEYAGQISLSIGIAVYPEHGRRFEQLYEAADKALYWVKKHGRGTYHLYDKPGYKGVIFDMDGTILNTIEDLLNATNFALLKNGFPTHTVEEEYYFVGNGLKKTVKRALPADTSPEIVEEVYRDMVEYYKVHGEDHTRPYDGIVEVIRELRAQGLKTAVVSNKADFATKALVDKFFPDCFDEVMGETEGFALKPDRAMVDEVLHRMGLEPSEAVYVGDSNVDLMTAKNAGVDCISVSWGFRPRHVLEELGAEIIADKPEELLKIKTS